MSIELIGVDGLPEIAAGDPLAELIAAATKGMLRDGDVLVIAQKVVSKAENAIVDLATVQVSDRARDLAKRNGGDAASLQVVLDQSVRIVREERVLIVETRHGFVCANAGVDHSNVPGKGMVTVLPDDCDASAARLRDGLRALSGADVAVIVSDTFGRPWRDGIVNVALGVAGVAALDDHRGSTDDFGQLLTATVVATADELAAAAGLVMGKTNRVPVVIIRGWASTAAAGTGRDLLRRADEDLFR